jgi:hypothetical protein
VRVFMRNKVTATISCYFGETLNVFIVMDFAAALEHDHQKSALHLVTFVRPRALVASSPVIMLTFIYIDAGNLGMEVGALVWITHPEQVWQLGRVLEKVMTQAFAPCHHHDIVTFVLSALSDRAWRPCSAARGEA